MKSNAHVVEESAWRNADPKITRIRIGNNYVGGWPDIPVGCPDGILLIAGESPEQRAFRRFPITSHKPGP